MRRKWQGTTLFALIMAGAAATIGGRLATASTPTLGTAQAPQSSIGTATGSTPASTPAPSSTASPATAGTPSASSTTVTGQTEQTPYGPVQVEVTFTGTKITAIKVLQVPDRRGRDAEIASYAVPQLEQEVLASQSAQVDTVSGATYTSGGYLASVQSAIDAHG
ncbi:FMN-binding protein [Humibacter albus]|uniref:FMN-binding protein n=1 Tax=Humibacter albus TaxID=427754 RepID=UPI0003B69E22|nr:FMN-binding protein [Humibacter albus]